MAKAKKIETEGHCFIIEEGIHHLAGLILRMLNFMQYDYPPSYKLAVETQFPGLFEKVEMLAVAMGEAVVWSPIGLEDDEIYTLYICYDLMGRLYVSDLYDKVMDDMQKDKPSPHPPDVMKRVYQHTLANIQPFLVGTELYAKKSNTLPNLGNIKMRLDSLPPLN